MTSPSGGATGAECGWRGSWRETGLCVSPGSLRGEGQWGGHVYRLGARKHGGRGRFYSPPPSFWLSPLAFPKARKGMGIWQTNRLSWYFPPPPCPPPPPHRGRQAGLLLPRSVNTRGLDIPSLLLMCSRLGNRVSFQGMSDRAESQGQMRPRDWSQSLAKLVWQPWAVPAGEGLPWGLRGVESLH